MSICLKDKVAYLWQGKKKNGEQMVDVDIVDSIRLH